MILIKFGFNPTDIREKNAKKPQPWLLSHWSDHVRAVLWKNRGSGPICLSLTTARAMCYDGRCGVVDFPKKALLAYASVNAAALPGLGD